jgi:hypothetical protein
MKQSILLGIALAVLAPLGGARADGPALLHVDNGRFFYDSNADCIGDTNAPAGAQALRHWHAGIPFAGADAEVAGGFGCAALGAGRPQTYLVAVPEGRTARVTGVIRYTWDTNVPGGGTNDVQLHAYNAAGQLVDSTLTADGPMPVVPNVLQVREHVVNFTLPAGNYSLVEDVFSGEHSAWLTQLEETLL